MFIGNNLAPWRDWYFSLWRFSKMRRWSLWRKNIYLGYGAPSLLSLPHIISGVSRRTGRNIYCAVCVFCRCMLYCQTADILFLCKAYLSEREKYDCGFFDAAARNSYYHKLRHGLLCHYCRSKAYRNIQKNGCVRICFRGCHGAVYCYNRRAFVEKTHTWKACGNEHDAAYRRVCYPFHGFWDGVRTS